LRAWGGWIRGRYAESRKSPHVGRRSSEPENGPLAPRADGSSKRTAPGRPPWRRLRTAARPVPAPGRDRTSGAVVGAVPGRLRQPHPEHAGLAPARATVRSPGRPSPAHPPLLDGRGGGAQLGAVVAGAGWHHALALDDPPPADRRAKVRGGCDS